MSSLYYKNNELVVENIRLTDLANAYGTPFYVYSKAMLEANWRAYTDAFKAIPHRLCYAVKANSNIAILNILARMNAGFDIVSLGELERVLAARGDAKKVVFSGVGKSKLDIQRAIAAGIFCFNVESEPELERLNAIASGLNTQINIAFRINPNIDPHTHSHISTGLSENKFGVELDEIIPLCQKLVHMPALHLIGIASHIGSQIVELEPLLQNVDCLLALYSKIKNLGITLQHIDIGGGLGITYQDETPPSIAAYAQAISAKIADYPVEVIMEPGRAIVGTAGALITRIEYLKHGPHKNFVITDAGMNDLIRPALYSAWQDIKPLRIRDIPKKSYDIAGPVCESADILGKDRELAVMPGDLLAIDCAGAYGFCMSSNYNTRCRPPEILVDGDNAHVIRPREEMQALFSTETLIPAPLREKGER